MAKCFKADGRVIEVVKGDITRLGFRVDAIVNPANSLMIMGGGVAGALKRVGGVEIEEEAMKHAPVPVGRAISTGAGRINARVIIHAPTMERPAMRIPVDNVYKATLAALEEARRIGAGSIAFPAMGAGVGGVSYTDSFQAMLDAVLDFKGGPGRIIFVAWGDEAYRAALEVLSRLREC